jgi:DNA-binding SARP family transcriptional activator
MIRALGDKAAARHSAPLGLVARDRELSELERALGQCRLGGSAVIVLRGEPGTGKSALVATIGSRARDFEVVQLRAGGEDALREWPGALREVLEGRALRLTGNLAKSVADAIGRLVVAEGVPVLLTIDDAQLLPASLLQALVDAVEDGHSSHPVLVVLALSDLPHVREVHLEVSPVSLCRLGGLTIEQAALLLERVLGRAPRLGVTRALVHAAGGNPEALIGASAALGEDVLEGWRPLPDPLPLDVSQREAFGSCLEGLGTRTRDALVLVAAGRMQRTVAEAALGALGLELSCLEPAIERGIVVLHRNRIAFSHPLVRSAAYALADDEARARAHEALAHAFALEGLVEVAAEHAARSAGARSSALGLYAQAVRVALDRSDLAAAARYQEVMAELASTSELTLQHLTLAGAWWLSTGEVPRARRCLDQAAALRAPVELESSLTYWRSRAAMAHEVGWQIAEELARAGEALAHDVSGQAVWMLGEAAVCLFEAGDAHAANELASQAVRAAQGGGFLEAYAQAVAASVRVAGHLDALGGDRLRPATSFLASQPDALLLSPLFAHLVGAALLEQSGPDAASTWASFLERNASSTGNLTLGPVAKLLGARVALRNGRLEEAAALASSAAEGAAAQGQRVVAVRALAVALEAQSLMGEHQLAFVTASRLFGEVHDSERALRATAYRALAELELQRSRVSSALSWLKAAEFEMTGDRDEGAPVDPRRATYVAALGEVLVHDGRLDAVAPLVELVDDAARCGAVEPAWAPALKAATCDDPGAADDLVKVALRLSRDEPALKMRIEVCDATRLARMGHHERAGRRLRSAAALAREIGAGGWATRCELALERLAAPASVELSALRPGKPAALAPHATPFQGLRGQARSSGHGSLDPSARWEITMLGSFVVRHEDSLISMPTSLAATALKLVALRRRILVDELVEELWPASAPGVGMRRLRNVLWRVRAVCGDIVLREDRLILLSPDAVTDVEVFRRIAVQALDPATPQEKAAELVRSALELYKGELLPMDRYADWAVATRESLARLKVQLLEVRVHQAVAEDRIQEALGLLDELIEADPYEETNYLKVAELHEKAGNRRLALAVLGRAERTLAELGIPPSPELKRRGQQLS